MSILKRRANPSFCIITPATPQYLNKFAVQSNTHLVLAHIADKNDEYADFYKQRAAEGDFIICDNGAYELGESYEPSKLQQIGRKCGAHALVLPDYPFQPANVTIDAAKRWAPAFKDAGFHTFYVPQSTTGDFSDWVNGYQWGAEAEFIDIIGMSILGIPNAIPHVPAAYARVVMTDHLIRSGVFAHHKYHHYLGLNAGPNLELPALMKMKAMDTCDSSNPVWAGICGHRYSTNTDSYLPVKKMKLEVNFNHHKLDELTADNIQYNIDLTLNLFKDNK